MKWVYGTVVGLVIIAFVYWLMGDEAPDLQAFPDELALQPDALVSQATLQHFSKEGELRYEIQADSTQIFETKGLTLLENLSFQVFTTSEESWQASASAGEFKDSETDQVLTLTGDAELRRVDGLGHVTKINSNELIFRPDQMILSSTEPVQITDRQSKIHADTIELDFEEQVLLLTSNADSQVEVLIWPET